MDEPRKCYAKEKKPAIKGHMVCDSIYMKHLEQADPLRQKVVSCLPVARGRGRGRGRYC